MVVLDTDHLSLLERRESAASQSLQTRPDRLDAGSWATMIVTYYPGKKDNHKRVTTERPHPTGGSCPREGHGKGKLIRILFSVYFGGFRG
jgi:hypothetical protein